MINIIEKISDRFRNKAFEGKATVINYGRLRKAAAAALAATMVF